MRLSTKEKAGLSDTSRIYEGIHLSKSFIRKVALEPESIEPEFMAEGERHFGFCGKCREKFKSMTAKPKQEGLPLEEE